MALSIAMPYLVRVARYVEERGVPREAVMRATSTEVVNLEDESAWVRVETFAEILLRASELLHDRSIGLALGLDTKPTSHSWYSYALITAKTIGDACRLGIRYLDLRLSPWRVSLSIQDDTAVMRFDQRVDLGEAGHLLLEYFLGAVISMGEFLHGRSLAGSGVLFRANYPRPAHHARFSDRLPTVIYDCESLEARHPASWLDRSLQLSDPEANREAVAMLDRQLGANGDDIVERTRAVLAASKHAFPELCGAAKLLAISERTLRRKLRDRGVSYRHLRDEARCVTALAELPSSQRSLDEFAALLGFANITAFSRAFKRWTGDTPGNYRRKLGR